METILIPADSPGAVARCAELLGRGEVVALPTETVYGLAADAANLRALAAVFEAKERPFFDPLIVHLPDAGWLPRLTEVPDAHRGLLDRLTSAFWPGPLTVLLPRQIVTVPDLVTAGSPLVAVRVSAHPVFRTVIAEFGGPLAAPSANRFGRISPTTGQHALSELRGRIPAVLDAGPSSHGLESTIVALEDQETLRILRHGPITAEALAELGAVRNESTDSALTTRSAPGQTEGHYAPSTPLTLLTVPIQITYPSGPDRARFGLLAFRRDRLPSSVGFERVEFLSESGDLREAAARFFAALRTLDEANLERIYAEPLPSEGLGRAIMDRLRRAATGSGPAR